jgi:small subunit ribosomal protein S11
MDKVQKKSNTQNKEAVVNIHASVNNTIINIADAQGNVLMWSSGGKAKMKGARKGLPFTGSKVGHDIASFIVNEGINAIRIVVKGVGYGRDNALRAMKINNVRILSIKDNTPIAHNGCKPQKRSRK